MFLSLLQFIVYRIIILIIGGIMESILGIDSGSVSVSLVQMDINRNILKSAYQFHKGAIKETILKMLKEFDLEGLIAAAVTSSSPAVFKNAYHSQLCLITAVKEYHPKAGSILNVGGENFGLIQFNESGDYESYHTNSSCAAGTGSFLDQQARRLNLESAEKLSEKAELNRDNTPKIATRCAVFAKTDLIHAQQKGFTLSQICDGLCEGLVKNISDTLFCEGSFRKPIVFTGGVSRNNAVVKHFTLLLGEKPITGNNSHLFGAIGAALLCLKNNELKEHSIKNISDIFIDEPRIRKSINQPLQLKLSDYPDFQSLEHYQYHSSLMVDNNVKIDIYEILKPENSVYLGIDIGSTSTKAVLMDGENNILAGFYTRTSGRPLLALQIIFESIEDICKRKNIRFRFLGASTTGSGRKFIGRIINADPMVDEITAHARAAYQLDPEVDTIIEIGGQDSKFTTLKNRMVNFSVMNNVCAAGTGSFIEEQAQKFGCSPEEYSSRVENVSSPL